MKLISEEAYKNGKNIGYFEIFFRPLFAFFKSYIVKGGVRNGLLGLLIAQKHYTSVQLKYSRMWYY